MAASDLILVATIGGPTSNSYQDSVSAQAILNAVPNTDAWDNADPDTQDQSLVRATQMFESLKWLGVKVGSYTSQALNWPRNFVPDPDYGSVDSQWIGWVGATVYLPGTVIPTRVLRGHAALALEILRAGTADVWGMDDTVNVLDEQVGTLRTQYADVSKRRLGLRAYPQVWREIFPLLELSRPGRVERA